jgi:hypothetical protein
MSEQDGLNPAERELEGALRRLAPAAARIDPVAAAFEAGRRSTRGRVRLWQSIAAAMVIVTVGTWLIPLRTIKLGGRLEVASTPTAEGFPAARPPSDQSLLMLRQAVWERGVDGLPAVALPPTMSRENKVLSIQRGES